MMLVELEVNGQRRVLAVPPLTRLIDVLRGPLGLTGPKEGCGEGECGSCAVLLDGVAVNACLVAIGQCRGRSVVTVEGLGSVAAPTALQRALVAHGGTQCGLCTPGMVVVAEELLRREGHPSEPQIRAAIAGNLCRCTGYASIVRSIEQAAAARAGDAQGEGA
jgi:carbon-monoxide dehydrogenase small subunit